MRNRGAKVKIPEEEWKLFKGQSMKPVFHRAISKGMVTTIGCLHHERRDAALISWCKLLLLLQIPGTQFFRLIGHAIPRSTICVCSECGEVFHKMESLEHHQAVRHADFQYQA